MNPLLIEEAREFKQERILAERKNTRLNEQIFSVGGDLKMNLNAVKSLQITLETEEEKTKCLLRAIEMAETGLGVSAKPGAKFHFNASLKFLSNSRKTVHEEIAKLNPRYSQSPRTILPCPDSRGLFCNAGAH